MNEMTGSKILRPRLVLLSMAVGAHLLLIFWTGIHSKKATAADALSHRFNVTLITLAPASSQVPHRDSSAQNEEEILPSSPNIPPSFVKRGPLPALSFSPIAIVQAPYYFPTDELTEKPIVVRDISPILSLGLPDAVSQSAELRLLINELGTIDRIVFETGDVPVAIQQLVREAFEKTQFEPGKIQDVPVRSQLRIEIMLEAVAPVE